ncbi:hypothetical protein Elgi_17360 [Paenibacillus elgii]|nr:hypothetical protein Elgi_17360 [Paenibacillus elgii]
MVAEVSQTPSYMPGLSKLPQVSLALFVNRTEDKARLVALTFGWDKEGYTISTYLLIGQKSLQAVAFTLLGERHFILGGRMMNRGSAIRFMKFLKSQALDSS